MRKKLYLSIYILNQLYNTKIKSDMENTKIQYQARHKNAYLILEHALNPSFSWCNDLHLHGDHSN